MASWPQGSAKAAASRNALDVDLDPKLEWHDCATKYLINFQLPGFKKDEFQVRVDAARRLTVRGQRPAGHVKVDKVVELPPTADVQRIAARFDGSVLYLTVPKVPVGAAEMVRDRMAEAKAEWEMKMGMEKERPGWDKGQVVAAAVAAFALGAIVTHKLLSARNA